MADVGAVASPIKADRAAVGMSPDFANQLRAATLCGRRFGQQHDCTVQPDRQHVIVRSERFEDRSVLDVRAEPADAGYDRLARFGMAAELARQSEQTQRGLQIDVGRLQGARQGHPLRLELAVALAELDIMAIGALLQCNRQSGPGVRAEGGFGRGGLGVALHRERPRKTAIRVIGAADEGTEFAELEAEPAGAANGTEARVVPGAVIREKVRAERLIEGRQHLADR